MEIYKEGFPHLHLRKTVYPLLIVILLPLVFYDPSIQFTFLFFPPLILLTFVFFVVFVKRQVQGAVAISFWSAAEAPVLNASQSRCRAQQSRRATKQGRAAASGEERVCFKLHEAPLPLCTGLSYWCLNTELLSSRLDGISSVCCWMLAWLSWENSILLQIQHGAAVPNRYFR